MAAHPLQVIVHESGHPLRTLLLEPGEHLIGRSGDCSLHLRGPDISRRHARLTWTGLELHIEDLGSKTGISVNGARVQGKTTLGMPQAVQVGSALLELNLHSEPAPGPPPEERLKGPRYRIEGPLAEGGMGTVYAARDLHAGRLVAMKVARENVQSSDEFRQRFMREAEVLGQLEHPNIVPLYELGLDAAGRAFYTMRFVNGITLAAVLDELKAGSSEFVARYPLAQLLTVFQKVCDAVAFAHSKRIIHRDLKPENVMIGGFGEVLVMDWGLAKVLPRPAAPNELTSPLGPASAFAPAQASLTLQGQVMGTPRFMAPEQAEGRVDEIDPRTDVFALGCMLYNILTLRPPLGELPVAEVFTRLQKGEIPPPTHFNKVSAPDATAAGPAPLSLVHCPGGRVPESLSALTMKAMAVERERRHQSVEDLQQELAAWQQDVAAGGETAGWRGWLGRRSRRRSPLF